MPTIGQTYASSAKNVVAKTNPATASTDANPITGSPAMQTVFFDLETGGFDPHKHPIIQIAAIAVDERLNELESFEAKIAFDIATADPEALTMNSFNADVWAKDARPETDVCWEFRRFLSRFDDVEMISKSKGTPYYVAQLFGHNADKFDGPFLQAWYKRLGVFLPASPSVMCTYQKAMHHFHDNGHLRRPADFKLGTLYHHYFGVELCGSHDAMVDLRANIQICQAMNRESQALVGAIDAMLPWALIGLAEEHPAVMLARKLGITAHCAVSPELLKVVEESIDKKLFPST
ncbi:3'-5' exonuclease [Anatilimnocola sp. NA78]|uniref:3'-5' exonuclease n=1 Tax=Anatilimnocola sp. NA78 TaxID=3415683 RepID=UPI003CE58F1F